MSRFNDYTKAHKGTHMSFFAFVNHMEKAEQAAQKAYEMLRAQQDEAGVEASAKQIVDKANNKKKKKTGAQTQQPAEPSAPATAYQQHCS